MTTTDPELHKAHSDIARLTGRTIEEVEAMTRDDLVDLAARSSFRTLAMTVVYGHDRAENIHLMDEGPCDQVKRVTQNLEKFHAHAPLWPVRNQNVKINIFGFGQAPIQFITRDSGGEVDDEYLLLSEVAEPLGIPLHRAHEWARQDHADALACQRELDEERGELGWECLRNLVDLELWMTVDDPEATPDAGGRRWSIAGDWLISSDRILALMTVSPWCKEFLDNAGPLFGHAFRQTMGDLLKDVPTYRADGTQTGITAYDALTRTEGLTVEEAAERAMRGPQLPEEEG